MGLYWGTHMRKLLIGAAVAALLTPAVASADILVSANGTTRIGLNADGSLNVNSPTGGVVGLGYNFAGQGGISGFYDALSPGCYCEAWGVSADGVGGQVGRETGNQNIIVNASSSTATSFTSNTELAGAGGLEISQTYSLSVENEGGALFKNTVVITNNTGADITELRYARAMDWDVPPTEFSEYSTFVGTGTTPSLLRSTNDGFASANPLDAVFNTGIGGVPVNSDGSFGIDDHGALFVFNFGQLLAGQTFTFNIFYGAASNESGALNLLSQISPELYNLGQSSEGGYRRDDLPTFVFAFNGVGGDIVVPPPTGAIPEPATWALMIGGFGLAGASLRRRRSNLGLA